MLYVGTAERRKGFDTLLDAMSLVARDRPDLSLVVTTRLDGFTPAANVRVVELGFVDDDLLAALYRGCTLLAFPSRYEGFGLPVIEAMSYGAAGRSVGRVRRCPKQAAMQPATLLPAMKRSLPRQSCASPATPRSPPSCGSAALRTRQSSRGSEPPRKRST